MVARVPNWRPVVGWESLYEVSDEGSVRSLTRVTPYRDSTRTFKGRELQQFSGGRYGYLQVKLSTTGHKETTYVHRLVLEAFAGPCPEGMEALHGPNGFIDNSLINLSWGTHQQNCVDKLRDGTDARGSNYGNARLTTNAVLEIRERQAAGETMSSLAREFGVHENTVHDIIARRTWSHI